MTVLRRSSLIVVAMVAIVAVLNTASRASKTETAARQDPSSLDRRISMLEQRFYSLESSMNRLQQYVMSQRSTGSSSDLRERELDQLRQEVQRLQLRLTEVECGLLKLDERTAPARGNRPRGEARPTDPCRVNPGAPLRLSSRP